MASMPASLPAFLGCLFLSFSACGADTAEPAFSLPPGFHIARFADVPNARAIAQSPSGTVFVGTRRDGRVFALRDSDGDGVADKRWTLARDLDMPTGVAFHRGALYIAASDGIYRLADIDSRLDRPPTPTRIHELPAYRHHGWRDIEIAPNGDIYIAMGAPCNVCETRDLGAIWRIAADGRSHEVFARGIRNSVGMTLDPRDGTLWFTDNGRDWMGDDMPPDELNHADRAGEHFGFPYCHAGKYSDPEFGKPGACREYRPPVRRLGAHVAPLGLTFYTGSMFPPKYRGQLLIAEHGSWNRGSKVGYRISLVTLDDRRATGYRTFVGGRLEGEDRVHGRPADVHQLPDGSLLISDDSAGRLYRLSYAD